MSRSLENSILEHKEFAKEVRLYDSDELFSQLDAVARCVCDCLVHVHLHAAISLLARYVILRKEIDRRIEEA